MRAVSLARPHAVKACRSRACRSRACRSKAPGSGLPVLDLSHELRGTLGELLDGTVEGRAVGGRDRLGEALREFDRDWGGFLVDRPAHGGERKEGFAQIGAVSAPGHKLSFF